jgi:hypothetical protein
MRTCHRQYPGKIDGTHSLVPSHRLRPSPENWRVGSCITRFEACSAFTLVMPGTLAKSPSRPSTSKAPTASLPLPLLRLLPGGANQFPGGSISRCGPAPFHGAQFSPSDGQSWDRLQPCFGLPRVPGGLQPGFCRAGRLPVNVNGVCSGVTLTLKPALMARARLRRRQ